MRRHGEPATATDRAADAPEARGAFVLPAVLEARRLTPCPDVVYVESFLEAAEADALFGAIRESTPWRQEQLTLFGRTRPAPRLTAWAGDAGLNYRYSGTDHACVGWTTVLARLRARVEASLAWRFDFVLLNRYRNGGDAMGWHADDESILGPKPVIASVSLGATRRFRLRRRDHGAAFGLDLRHGSLLVMFDESQRYWLHALPRVGGLRAASVGERINLTFRTLRGGPR